MPVMIIPKAKFRWIQGEERVRIWHKPGHDWASSFCPTCGSALPGDNDADHMFIPAGLLKEADNAATIKHHIYTASKASWDVIGDEGIHHPDGFGSAQG